MTLRGTIILAAVNGLILAGGISAAHAATTNSPDFKEVYDLLRAHLPEATDESLNQAAVTGLLSQLNGRASLVGDSATPDTNAAPVKAAVINQTVAYFRVRQIDSDLAARLTAAGQTLSTSNKLIGTILDLRFASGTDYAVVKDSVDLLTAPKTPIIVLVDGATSGAAELLTAELRDASALIIGGPTAGLAMTTEDFPLANGEHLRLATTPIQFHGTGLARLQPDITIATSLAEDRNFMANPYGPVTTSDSADSADTNRLAELLDHTSEADLVRQKRKDGFGTENPELQTPETTVANQPVQPVLRDPAMARAVDLIEGLAVVRAGHV